MSKNIRATGLARTTRLGVVTGAVLGLLAPSIGLAVPVLAVDEGGRLSAGGWTDLFTDTFNDDVTVISSWSSAPADLSAYDIVWDGGFFSNPGAAVAQNVVDFVNAGGGFYGQTERPCCETHNDWVEGIFRTLTGDTAMQFGGAGDSPSGATGTFLTPDTTILLEPNDIRNTTFDISAPGQLSVSDPSKVFAAQLGPGGFNIGIAYATSDLVNNAGRIVTISDIDWLSGIDADEANALENIRRFLLGGESLPPGCGEDPSQPGCQDGEDPTPVPEPSALLLLAAGLLAVRLTRLRR